MKKIKTNSLSPSLRRFKPFDHLGVQQSLNLLSSPSKKSFIIHRPVLFGYFHLSAPPRSTVMSCPPLGDANMCRIQYIFRLERNDYRALIFSSSMDYKGFIPSDHQMGHSFKSGWVGSVSSDWGCCMSHFYVLMLLFWLLMENCIVECNNCCVYWRIMMLYCTEK